MQSRQAKDPNQLAAQGSAFVLHKVDSQCFLRECYTAPLSPPSLFSQKPAQGRVSDSCQEETGKSQLVQPPKMHTIVAAAPIYLQNEQAYLVFHAKLPCCPPPFKSSSVNHVCDMITPNIKGKSLHTL